MIERSDDASTRYTGARVGARGSSLHSALHFSGVDRANLSGKAAEPPAADSSNQSINARSEPAVSTLVDSQEDAITNAEWCHPVRVAAGLGTSDLPRCTLLDSFNRPRPAQIKRQGGISLEFARKRQDDARDKSL
jgi:hypothetical protein